MKRLLFFATLALLCWSGLRTSGAATPQDRDSAQAEPSEDFRRSFSRARALMGSGAYDEAIKEFKRASSLRHDQCPECLQMIGQNYFEMRKFKEAAAAYRQAADFKPPNESELYNTIGVALYLADDKKVLDEAAAALRRSIELADGRVGNAYFNLGHVLIKAGKVDEGVEALKKHLELNPNADNAAEARALIAKPLIPTTTTTKKANDKAALPANVTTKTSEVALDKFRGKVVLLDFWATWCGPCRAEMPVVKEIWKKYNGENFALIGISLDKNQNSLQAYIQQQGISWLQYYDGNGWNNSVARQYGVHSIPHSILVDHKGKIQAVGLRGTALDRKIEQLLEDVPKAAASRSN